jgi:hypothetical protein
MKTGNGLHYFIAGFNLGVIFELIKHFGIDMTQIIIERLKNSDYFEILQAKNDQFFDMSPGKLFLMEREVTSYPISDPIIFKYKEKVIEDLLNNFNYENTDIYKWEEIIWHEFWIIPTGTFLFIGIFEKSGDLTNFDNEFVSNNYNLLANIFKSVIQNLELENLKTLLVQRNISKIAQIMSTSKMGILREIPIEDYESLLEDVYYIEVLNGDEIKYQIGYQNTKITVNKEEAKSVSFVVISYSIFLNMICFQKFLKEKIAELKRLMIQKSLVRSALPLVKQLKLFITEFVSSSHPISIRLTETYMQIIKEFHKNSYVDELQNQIYSQINTIDDIISWMDTKISEQRDLKLGLIAILFTLISISSVCAQIISTVDIYNSVSPLERIYLILIGFIFGLIVSSLIFAIPK